MTDYTNRLQTSALATTILGKGTFTNAGIRSALNENKSAATMMSSTANLTARKGGDHFMVCPGCLARVDVRKLSEVLKHLHGPDETEATTSTTAKSA